MAFKVGDWIQNKKYGAGQIEKTFGPEKYEVRFVDSPSETRTLIEAGLAPGAPPHEGFKFPRPARTRTPGASTANYNRKPPLDFDHLLQGFLRTFPGGFEGESFARNEGRYKDDAAALMKSSLGEQTLRDLIARSDMDSFVDAVKKVVQASNLIFSHEKIKLVAGLKQVERQSPFAHALFDLLYGNGPEDVRFTKFVDIISVMDAGKWTVATYFQFLVTDGAKMFMKPGVVKPMAESVNVSLDYNTFPNWLTYTKLQEVGMKVHEMLVARGQKPRNGLDVQSFIWASIRIAQDDYEKYDDPPKAASAGCPTQPVVACVKERKG